MYQEAAAVSELPEDEKADEEDDVEDELSLLPGEVELFELEEVSEELYEEDELPPPEPPPPQALRMIVITVARMGSAKRIGLPLIIWDQNPHVQTF